MNKLDNINKKTKYSDKKSKYNADYTKNNYKTLKNYFRIEEKEIVANYCKANGMSISNFLKSAVFYCIDNNITFDD